MTRRHSKLKTHLVEQYQRQVERIEDAILEAYIKYVSPKNSEIGSYFSERFKK